MTKNNNLFNLDLNPILGVIILVLLLIQVVDLDSCSRGESKKGKTPTQYPIDSLLEVNKKLDSTITLLQDSHDSLTEMSKKTNRIKIQIKENYNEKINLVDSYTDSEIDSFFSDRYSQNDKN